MPKKLSDFTTGQRVTDSASNSRIYVSKSGSDKYVEHADLVSRDYHTGIQPLSTISDAGAMAALDEAALSNIAAMPVSTIVGNSSTSASAAPTALTATQARTLLNVEDGATNNGETAYLLARENHTGVMPVSAVEGLDTALADIETNSVTTKEITLDIGGTQLPVVLGADDSGETGYRILQVLNDGEPASPGVLNITSGNIDINEGGTHVFSVSRTGGTSGTTVGRWTVSASGITTATTGTLTWNDTESGTRSVTLTGADVASNQSGTITLTVDSGTSTLGTDDVTIIVRYIAPETPGVMSVSSNNNFPVGESGSTFPLYIDRSTGSDGAVAVDWSCTSGSHTTVLSGTEYWIAGNSQRHTITLTRATVGTQTIGTVTLSNARRTDGGTTQPTISSTASYVSFGIAPSTNPGTISLVSTAIDENENTPLPIVLTRAGGSYGAVTARWTITGVGVDTTTGTVTWASGEFGDKPATTLPVGSFVTSDDTDGVLTVSIASGSATLLAPTTGTIAVRNVAEYTDYTLQTVIARHPAPFAWSTPVAIAATPVTTATINVPADMSLTAALAINGRRILLAAGSYGDVTITGTDQEIVLTTGVTIGGLRINDTARRIKVTANPVRSGAIQYFRFSEAEISTNCAQDITLDGVTQVYQPTSNTIVCDNRIRVQRFTMLNCAITQRSFALVTFSGTTSASRATDYIIANNYIYDGGPALGGTGNGESSKRSAGILREVFVDNRLYHPLESSGSLYQTYRIHSSQAFIAQWHYVRKNQFEGLGHQISNSGNYPTQVCPPAEDLFYIENRSYIPAAATSQEPINMNTSFAEEQRVKTITITGNASYGGGSWPSAGGAPSGGTWTISSNTTAAYTTPPAWDFDDWSDPASWRYIA